MSSLIKTMVTSIVSILFIGAVAYIIILQFNGEKNKTGAQSIDQMVEYSYQTPEVTTDLEDGSFVRIQFQVVTDGKDAKKEISKRDFQIRNILIKELATMNEEDFKTGLGKLEDKILAKLNEIMTDGKVIDVYTISKILQ